MSVFYECIFLILRKSKPTWAIFYYRISMFHVLLIGYERFKEDYKLDNPL